MGGNVLCNILDQYLTIMQVSKESMGYGDMDL